MPSYFWAVAWGLGSAFLAWGAAPPTGKGDQISSFQRQVENRDLSVLERAQSLENWLDLVEWDPHRGPLQLVSKIFDSPGESLEAKAELLFTLTKNVMSARLYALSLYVRVLIDKDFPRLQNEKKGEASSNWQWQSRFLAMMLRVAPADYAEFLKIAAEILTKAPLDIANEYYDTDRGSFQSSVSNPFVAQGHQYNLTQAGLRATYDFIRAILAFHRRRDPALTLEQIVDDDAPNLTTLFRQILDNRRRAPLPEDMKPILVRIQKHAAAKELLQKNRHQGHRNSCGNLLEEGSDL